MKNLGGEALFFAQQAKQQMFGSDVLVIEPLGFFRSIGQHAFALVAQRQVDRRGNLLARRCMAFDLFANRFDGRMGPKKPVG